VLAPALPRLTPVSQALRGVVGLTVPAQLPTGIATRFPRLHTLVDEQVVSLILADNEVFGPVVSSDSVRMMDNCLRRKRPAKSLFGNQYVFAHIATPALRAWVLWHIDPDVTSRVHNATVRRSVVAGALTFETVPQHIAVRLSFNGLPNRPGARRNARYSAAAALAQPWRDFAHRFISAFIA